MSRLNKVIFTILFILACLFLCSSISNADSSLFLDNLKFEVQINEDASMNVTEIWDISISDTNTLYKTFKRDQSRYSSISAFKVSDITDEEVIFRDINKEMYHVTPNCYYGLINSDGLYEVAFGVNLENKTDRRKYKIEYKVNDAISKNNDYAELYWQFVGEDFEIDASKIEGEIVLPEKVEDINNIKVWGHTEDLNGVINAIDEQTVKFELDDFNSGKYVEVRVLFPTEMIIASARGSNTDILNNVIEEETKWANDANARRAMRDSVKVIICIAINIASLVILVMLLRNYKKLKKSTESVEEIESTQKLDYFRDIPRENATPAEAVFLIKKGKYGFSPAEIGTIFSATLLDLSLKKKIEFEVDENAKKKENIKIKIINYGDTDLSMEEKEIFDFLKGLCKKNNEITQKELEKKISNCSPTKIEKFKSNISKYTKKNLIQQKLFDEEREKIFLKLEEGTVINFVWTIMAILVTLLGYFLLENIWVAFSTVLLLISTIINLIRIGTLKSKLTPYTQKGLDEIEEWKGLKKYMEDYSLLNEKKVFDIVLWEKFLVFATAFGIADKVIKQLKIVYPDIDQNIDLNHYAYFHVMMHTNFSTGFVSSVSSSMSSAYSSGTGGGGGFSGGGGGGRRPEVEEEEDNSSFNYLI